MQNVRVVRIFIAARNKIANLKVTHQAPKFTHQIRKFTHQAWNFTHQIQKYQIMSKNAFHIKNL